MRHFVASFDRKQNISAQNINAELDLANLRIQISNLQQIGENFGVSIQQFATAGARNATQKGFFYSATNVAQGNLHKFVYDAGKFIGFKFKPWGAVNMAKNIGNVAKCVGPALAVAGVALEIMDLMKQREIEQKMADARCYITSQFQAIGKDLESQLGMQLGDFNTQFYGGIEQQITAARQQQEDAISTSNIWMKELLNIRAEFNIILSKISSVSCGGES